MPAVFLERSPVCPIPFVALNEPPNGDFSVPNFLTDWDYVSQEYFARPVRYYQKWQLDDNIAIQFGLPSVGPSEVVLEVVDCRGALQAIVPIDQMLSASGNTYQGLAVTTYQYKASFTNLALDAGRYIFRLTVTYNDGPVYYVSEPMDVEAQWPGTIPIDYAHNYNEDNTFFSLNPNFRVRVEGMIEMENVKYDDTDYTDEIARPKKLDSKKIRQFELTVGTKLQYSSEPGIPRWMFDLLCQIFGLKFTAVKGKRYVRPNNEAFDPELRRPTMLLSATLTLQEADPNNISILGSADVFIVALPFNGGGITYPYALSPLSISNGFSTMALTNNEAVEILGSTAQALFLANLNALPGLAGTFVIENNNLYYRNSAFENFISGTGTSYAKHTDFTITTINGTSFRYQYRGTAHVSVWNGSEVRYYPTNTLPLPATMNAGTIDLPDNTTTTLRIYHNDNLSRLFFPAPISQNFLTGLTNYLPATLTHFSITGGHVVTTFNLNRLNPTAYTLQFLNLSNAGIQNFTAPNPAWEVSPPGFNLLTYVDIRNNDITLSSQQTIIEGYRDAGQYAHAGTWMMQGQGNGPVNTATLNAITDMQNAGWVVTYDT